MKININKSKGEEFKKKIIDFGNCHARILEINYREITKDLANISLVLETKEDDSFVGITTKKGVTYKGAVAFTDISNYLINLKKQNTIDITISKLQTIAKACGVHDEFIKLDGKHDTLKDFVNDFKKLDIYNKYLYWCLGGKYKGQNEKGYDVYSPYIVNNSISGFFVSNDESKVIKFNKSLHFDDYIKEQMQKKESTQNINNSISNDDGLPDFLNNKKDNTNTTLIDNDINDNINDDIDDSVNSKDNNELPF